jgi:endonuclease/exonuclease/phosphatase family metal-dependent hydrolase
MAVWLRLRDRASQLEFLVAGTHLDNNRENKPHAVALLAERLSGFGPGPKIVAGDFNLQATSEMLEVLTSPAPPALVDSFDLARDVVPLGAPPGPVERGCKDFLSQPFPRCRIDHVFVDRQSGWAASRHTVDLRRLGPNGNFVSDHRAIWVDLELELTR